MKPQRPRGFILMYGLAVLAVVMGAVLLLAHAATSRADVLRGDAARENALRSAESALEQARLALAAGSLKAGQSVTINNLAVSCASSPSNGADGVKLETLALCGPAASRGAYTRTGVRVTWELRKNGNAWTVAGWRMSNETVMP
jgi:Tfp pilus assembly protein PilX